MHPCIQLRIDDVVVCGFLCFIMSDEKPLRKRYFSANELVAIRENY